MKYIMLLILPLIFLMESCLVKSCSGYITVPRCAKYCTHDAVVNCEFEKGLDRY